jgi:hypothetical protein
LAEFAEAVAEAVLVPVGASWFGVPAAYELDCPLPALEDPDRTLFLNELPAWLVPFAMFDPADDRA